MADTVRFALTYDAPGAGPASVVGKFASEDEQSHNTGRMMRAYEVEVRFYAEVAPRVPARMPRLLFAAFDPAESWFTLLLEDLDDAAQGDEIAGCGPDVAAAALGQLAALHAACWEDPDLAGNGWLDRSSPESDEFTLALVTGLFPGFLERYGDQLADPHRALLEAFIPRLVTFLARPRGPRTLVHADFRLDNLLFTPDRPEPAVVDFQTVNWACGAYDVAYFVGGSMEPEVRRGRRRTARPVPRGTGRRRGARLPDRVAARRLPPRGVRRGPDGGGRVDGGQADRAGRPDVPHQCDAATRSSASTSTPWRCSRPEGADPRRRVSR